MILIITAIIILVILLIIQDKKKSSRYIDLGNGISCKMETTEYATGSPHKEHDGMTSNLVSSPDNSEYTQMMINSAVQPLDVQPDPSDYNQYIINTGIEPSVLTAHRTFTDDLQNTTVGASARSEFSHDDDIVPKWGLRRTSPYIPISPNARDVPSLTDEQMKINSSHGNPIAQALFG